MHDLHDALPGYDPGNILHDGCGECEDRAANPLSGLTVLDHGNFQQAWADMLAIKWSGGKGLDRNISACDNRLMNALYLIAVLLESNAGINPHDLAATINERADLADAKLREMFG